MCIVHWILGIGDRHLTNCLIDQNTGELIGIDFNMSFGAGIRQAALPELTPFRLTAQYVNALSPLRTHGLLSECMAHALRKFSLVEKSLVTTLDMFVRETSANWLDVSGDGEKDLHVPGVQLLPWQRVKMISSKLKGVDPRRLLKQELESGFMRE